MVIDSQCAMCSRHALINDTAKWITPVLLASLLTFIVSQR